MPRRKGLQQITISPPETIDRWRLWVHREGVFKLFGSYQIRAAMEVDEQALYLKGEKTKREFVGVSKVPQSGHFRRAN